VLELAKAQEATRLQELRTREAEARALAERASVERERVHHDELRKTNAASQQHRAQLARFEDELARARAAAEHEASRERNAETVRLQEVVAERQEAVRRASEEKIQQSRRQTEQMKAELERETLRVKALAEAEGRAAEARASEDVNRRLLLSRVEAETSKAVAVLRAAVDAAGSALRAAEPRHAAAAVASATALAVGVFGAREGMRSAFRHLDRLLGTPSLVRETTRRSWLPSGAKAVPAAAAASTEALLANVVLPPALRERVRVLASSMAQSRGNGALFRNFMFYGVRRSRLSIPLS